MSVMFVLVVMVGVAVVLCRCLPSVVVFVLVYVSGV